jgi:hypothetical protein
MSQWHWETVGLPFIRERRIFIKMRQRSKERLNLSEDTHPPQIQELFFSFPSCLINLCSFAHPIIQDLLSSISQGKVPCNYYKHTRDHHIKSTRPGVQTPVLPNKKPWRIKVNHNIQKKKEKKTFSTPVLCQMECNYKQHQNLNGLN